MYKEYSSYALELKKYVCDTSLLLEEELEKIKRYYLRVHRELCSV